MKKYIMTGLMVALVASFGIAQAAGDQTKELQTKLDALLPDSGIVLAEAKKLDNTGLYEILMNGEVAYISADAQYVFQGDMISVATRENLTDIRREVISKTALAAMDEKEFITYEPKETVHTVTVFTDIDCGYCRKMHQQIEAYQDLGIRIRYAFYPRSGIGGDSYKSAVNVWCSDDKLKALTDAKNGVAVAEAKCDSPIKSQYELGQRIGVTGTPAIFLESGKLVPGYVPPAQLKQMLDAG
jgi:thiol:disulfide interchange protein DsbC